MLLAVNGLLGVATAIRFGFYDPWAMLAVVGAWSLLLVTASSVSQREEQDSARFADVEGARTAPGVPWHSYWGSAIGIWLVVGAVAALRTPVVLGAMPSFRGASTAHALGMLAAGVAALLAVVRRRTAGRGWPRAAIASIVAGTCLHAAVPVVKPAPTIDVYTAFTDGAAALLRGDNPYETPVRDPYTDGAEQFGYRLGNYMYPPANLPPHAASLAAFGDVRYAHVAGELATAILLAVAIRRRRPDLWHSPVALLTAGPFLFTKGAFIIEQSWNEPLMLAALTGWWCCCHAGRLRMGALCFGAFLSLKQYLLWWPIAFVADALARRRPGLILLPPLLVGATVLPFLAWNATAFWDHAVRFMAARQLRVDGLSIPAWLHHTFDVDIASSIPCLMVGGAVAAWLSWRIVRRGESAASPEQLLLAGATATTTMFLFGPQGFANYYYLVSQTALIAAIGLLVVQCETADA